MGSRITINEAKVNGVYERIMDEIYLMFHNHPLSFPTGPISESDLVEMNYYQAMGRSFYQSLNSTEAQLKAQAQAARERGDIGGLQSVQRQARTFNKQINPKFAHLHRSGRTR